MTLSRRDALWIGLGGIAAAVMPGTAALAATVDELTAAFTGAVAILLLASGNPEPAVAPFTFGPAAATRRAATRIRLAQTQDVIALAKMGDGSIVKAQATVKVTIGGCGG